MHDMASLLQIRNVSDEVRRALKARAAARGESLNTYLLELVSRDVERPTIEEVLERAARRSERAQISALEVMDVARAERDLQLRQGSDA
jgi:antitoxin FitA